MQRRWANIVIEIGQEYKKKNNVDNLTSELMQKKYMLLIIVMFCHIFRPK